MNIDLSNPGYFFNRELSWLKFNLRVLKEGGVKTTPLMERLKFVSISASNLDEFFMVRVAGLYDQLENGINKKDAAGLSVEEQLEKISQSAHTQMKLKYRYFFSLLKEMRNYGLNIKYVKEVDAKGREWLETYYNDFVYPVLTPMLPERLRELMLLKN